MIYCFDAATDEYRGAYTLHTQHTAYLQQQRGKQEKERDWQVREAMHKPKRDFDLWILFILPFKRIAYGRTFRLLAKQTSRILSFFHIVLFSSHLFIRFKLSSVSSICSSTWCTCRCCCCCCGGCCRTVSAFIHIFDCIRHLFCLMRVDYCVNSHRFLAQLWCSTTLSRMSRSYLMGVRKMCAKNAGHQAKTVINSEMIHKIFQYTFNRQRIGHSFDRVHTHTRTRSRLPTRTESLCIHILAAAHCIRSLVIYNIFRLFVHCSTQFLSSSINSSQCVCVRAISHMIAEPL